MNLMEAIGGISDRHIEEFACVSPKKRLFKPWMAIASAACLAVIAAATVIVPIIKNNESYYNAYTSPRVYFNDREYRYLGRHYTEEEKAELPGYPDSLVYEDGYYELPDGYVEVGEITSNYYKDEKVNGFGAGPKVGEKIYQDPEHLEDLYVYTLLFSNVKYRYIHFVDVTTYGRVRINGKTYIKDYSVGFDERYLTELPDVYSENGGVTTTDPKYRYVDGFGQDLYIGDKIYCSHEEPDVVYVYTEPFSDEYYYVRFVVCDE